MTTTDGGAAICSECLPLDDSTCTRAAENGHLDCLRCAHEHKFPWNALTCAVAAENGHLDCLRFAREHGCPWDKWTCVYAAARGHLDCLRYAHENECPWIEWTCEGAAERGHLDCLRYAVLRGCPFDSLTEPDIRRARTWIRWHRLACAVRAVRVLGCDVKRRRRLKALWTGEVLRELREAPAGNYSGRMASFSGGVDWCAARGRHAKSEEERSRKRKREDSA